jgi:hypothetical protein
MKLPMGADDARRHAFAARLSSNKETEAVRWPRHDHSAAERKTKNCADNLTISDREFLADASAQ